MGPARGRPYMGTCSFVGTFSVSEAATPTRRCTGAPNFLPWQYLCDPVFKQEENCCPGYPVVPASILAGVILFSLTKLRTINIKQTSAGLYYVSERQRWREKPREISQGPNIQKSTSETGFWGDFTDTGVWRAQPPPPFQRYTPKLSAGATTATFGT